MTEPIDDQFTFFRRLQQFGGGTFTVTQRLLDEIEDAYGPIGWMRDWWDKTYSEALSYFEDYTSPVPAAVERARTTPPPALRGPAALPSSAEERRVTRELVPLVRQAAADHPVGDIPRLDPDLARLRIFWPQGKPLPQPALADWANKPVTWPSIVGWYRDQEQRQHDVDCGCPAHSWWLP